MKTILHTPDRRRLRQERRRAAGVALAAPMVPFAFLAGAFETRSMVRALTSDLGAVVTFVGGVAVGASVVLAIGAGRRFTRSGGTRLRGILLAAAAPVVALLALLAGRFP